MSSAMRCCAAMVGWPCRNRTVGAVARSVPQRSRRSTCRVCRWMGAPLAVGNQLGSPDMPAEAVPAGRALIDEQAAVLDTRERPTRPPEQLPASTVVLQALVGSSGRTDTVTTGRTDRARGCGQQPQSGAVEAVPASSSAEHLDRDAGRRVQLGRLRSRLGVSARRVCGCRESGAADQQPRRNHPTCTPAADRSPPATNPGLHRPPGPGGWAECARQAPWCYRPARRDRL